MICKIKLLYYHWVLMNIRRELYELTELVGATYCRDYHESMRSEIEELQQDEERVWNRIAQLTKGN